MNQIHNTFLATLLGLILAMPSYADTYRYDALNRLIFVTHHETAQITRYTYDAGGNLLNATTTELPKYNIDIYTKDKQGNPLASVTITINEQTITSDENGYLPLTDFLADTYTIIAILHYWVLFTKITISKRWTHIHKPPKFLLLLAMIV